MSNKKTIATVFPFRVVRRGHGLGPLPPVVVSMITRAANRYPMQLALALSSLTLCNNDFEEMSQDEIALLFSGSQRGLYRTQKKEFEQRCVARNKVMAQKRKATAAGGAR
jgi:hypothetical protein